MFNSVDVTVQNTYNYVCTNVDVTIEKSQTMCLTVCVDIPAVNFPNYVLNNVNVSVENVYDYVFNIVKSASIVSG